jgi:hypothetical protein
MKFKHKAWSKNEFTEEDNNNIESNRVKLKLKMSLYVRTKILMLISLIKVFAQETLA